MPRSSVHPIIHSSGTKCTIMSRYVVGTQMKDGEVVYVKAPANDAQEGTCAWCGGGFDMRCIAMLTQMEDGCWDW